MRRFLVPALALMSLLFLSRPAQAFHHHTYSQPYAPAYGAPAAPLAPGMLLNLVSAGLQLYQALDGSSETNRILQIIGQHLPQQNVQLPPVPSDVVDTINRVDKALPDVVDKSNKIAGLNPDLYKQDTNWKRVGVAETTPGGGTSGAPGTGSPPTPKTTH